MEMVFKIYIFQVSTTAVFIKTVPLVYTRLLNNVFLSHSTQVAGGIVFRKHTECGDAIKIKLKESCRKR